MTKTELDPCGPSEAGLNGNMLSGRPRHAHPPAPLPFANRIRPATVKPSRITHLIDPNPSHGSSLWEVNCL